MSNHDYKLQLITPIEENNKEEKNNSDYSYKIKVSGKTIVLNDSDAVQALIDETDKLVQDDDKNEKISIQFRTVNKNPTPPLTIDLIDMSVVFEKNGYGQLLNGATIEDLMEGYAKYVKENVQPEYPDLELQIEMIKIYYPLDKDSKKENIPDLGHIVQYHKDNGHGGFDIFTVDCRDSVKTAPNFNMFSSIKRVASRIKTIKGTHNIENPRDVSYNKNTLH